MSVHYRIKPHWEYHDLASKYRAQVGVIGRFYDCDDIDSDEVAWRISLKLCLDGRQDLDVMSLKKRFLSLCRYEFLKQREKSKHEIPMRRFPRADGEDRSDGEILGSLGTSTAPRQEEYTLLMQCMKVLGELPMAHQRVMRKIARGDSAIDIALAEGRDLQEVLSEIKVARDWVHQWAKTI